MFNERDVACVRNDQSVLVGDGFAYHWFEFRRDEFSFFEFVNSFRSDQIVFGSRPGTTAVAVDEPTDSNLLWLAESVDIAPFARVTIMLYEEVERLVLIAYRPGIFIVAACFSGWKNSSPFGH